MLAAAITEGRMWQIASERQTRSPFSHRLHIKVRRRSILLSRSTAMLVAIELTL